MHTLETFLNKVSLARELEFKLYLVEREGAGYLNWVAKILFCVQVENSQIEWSPMYRHSVPVGVANQATGSSTFLFPTLVSSVLGHGGGGGRPVLYTFFSHWWLV